MDAKSASEFNAVFTDTRWREAFHEVLRNTICPYPAERFHALIRVASDELDTDEAIYRRLQRELPKIKPFMGWLRLALPALRKQKREVAAQTQRLLAPVNVINSYVEVGSTGRYFSELRHRIKVNGSVFLVNRTAPSWSPASIAERGGLRKVGVFLPLRDYEPLPAAIADESIDLVTCYTGLHSCPPDRLDAFVRSIVRVLRPRAVFMLREHDVATPAMNTFVSLAHTAANLGAKESWEAHQGEPRHFRPLAEWVAYLGERGLCDKGQRELQPGDPSENVLLAFTKIAP